MKTLTTSIVALALVAGAFAQGKEQPLWPNGTPGAKGDSPRDIPTLTPFLAPAGNNSDSAIVICPGGGYGGLAAHEGATYAQFLQQHGV
ncbi:MAG: alpha/beta hydrolase, partial [Verrucomicrobiales bacterium]|nr:alpha/beta hydrolase [Verrucomicrobiales bacterium]